MRLRLLGADALAPGTRGSVRLFLPVPLPMLPGDRYVLRESGRDETIGGGEVLDIAPVTKASHAAPDGTVARAIAERGWVDVGELELLTGVAVEPVIGHWATTPELLEATRPCACAPRSRPPASMGWTRRHWPSTSGRSC